MLNMSPLLFLGLFIAQSISHTITSVDVPRWADPRRAAELRCRYARQPRDPPLHSVKWYRDQREVFRYTPQAHETRVFNDSGVTVTNSSCDARACAVSVRPERGDHKYTCEVSSEGPRFAVDRLSANMALAVLPEYDPLITGLPALAQPDEPVLVNCTADYSLPAAAVDWFVDDELQEEPAASATHASGADADGLRAAWRALRVGGAAARRAADSARGYLTLRCRARLATSPPADRAMAVRLYVATRPHISMFTANGAGGGAGGGRRGGRWPLWLALLISLQVPL